MSLLLFRHHRPLGTITVNVEPRLETGEIVKNVRQQKVQKRPQLGQIVLQRRPSQQQSIQRTNAHQLAHQPAIDVFDAVPFVNHQVFPGVPTEKGGVLDDRLVIGHYDGVWVSL